jgi:hypothetical protein
MKIYGEFQKFCENVLVKWKNAPFLPTTFINRFKRSCDTFGWGVGGKEPLSSTTLGQFAWEKNLYFIYLKNNNDHGLDVSIIIIYNIYFENDDI